jgi:hypothetical protein
MAKNAKPWAPSANKPGTKYLPLQEALLRVLEELAQRGELTRNHLKQVAPFPNYTRLHKELVDHQRVTAVKRGREWHYIITSVGRDELAKAPRVAGQAAIPPEVRAFAAEMKVEEYLPVVLELVHRHFPRADLSVILEEDPEVESLRHIVVRAWGAGMTVEEAFAATDGFNREMFAHLPHPLVWLVRLSLRLGR